VIDAFVRPTSSFVPFARTRLRLSGPGTGVGPAASTADVRVDPVALGEALQREAPILLAAARAITLDDREAEDLVQTTFELALRNVRHLREPAALRAWLLTIQAREAFRVSRRLRRTIRLAPAVADATVAPAAGSDDLAVRAALKTLPPRMRAAVVLHHMAGLKVTEVAAALGTSDNTVKSQLKVGLARLREVLGDD
jgi:RNA polymerase sigma factor (sigma-70 family)